MTFLISLANFCCFFKIFKNIFSGKFQFFDKIFGRRKRRLPQKWTRFKVKKGFSENTPKKMGGLVCFASLFQSFWGLGVDIELRQITRTFFKV